MIQRCAPLPAALPRSGPEFGPVADEFGPDKKLFVELNDRRVQVAGLFNMGTVYLQMGDRDQARRYLQRFLALHPNHRMAGLARQKLSE